MLKPAHTSLLEVQNRVREDFGWSETEDLESATSLKAEFSKPNPFGVRKWNDSNFFTNIMLLKDKLIQTVLKLKVARKKEMEQIKLDW